MLIVIHYSLARLLCILGSSDLAILEPCLCFNNQLLVEMLRFSRPRCDQYNRQT